MAKIREMIQRLAFLTGEFRVALIACGYLLTCVLKPLNAEKKLVAICSTVVRYLLRYLLRLDKNTHSFKTSNNTLHTTRAKIIVNGIL